MSAVEGTSVETIEYNFERANVCEITKDETVSESDSQKLTNQSLSERIKKTKAGAHTVHIIDKVIRVKTLSRAEINKRIAHWDSKKSVMNWTAFGSGTGTVLALGFAFTNPIASIPGCIVAGVCGLIAMVALYRSSEAGTQKGLWEKNHAIDIAMERKEAFKRGFIHVMSVDRRNDAQPKPYSAVLTNNEIRGLYQRYFYNFVEEVVSEQQNKQKMALMSQAVNQGPLSSKCLTYARLSEEELYALAPLIEGYKQFTQSYREVDDQIRAIKSSAREKAQKEIDEIQKKRDKALKKLETSFNKYKEQIQKTADSQLGREIITGEDIEGNNEKFIEEGRIAIVNAEEEYRENRENMAKPYNDQIKKIESDRDSYLKNLEKDRKAFLLPIYRGMLALHQEAYRVFMGEISTYELPRQQEGFPPLYTPPQFVEPSAPPFYPELVVSPNNSW